MCSAIYIAGIEGGATHSTLVLMDAEGNTVVTLKGLGTNHWIVGMEECRKRIADMVERAKAEAGIPSETPLTSLGLSLSGCEQEESNAALEYGMRKEYPHLSKAYVVCSDTQGSLATAEPLGGVVLIYGTGSNGLLINPDGTKFQCGGWGHMLGDEGSAWWISHRAVKIVFDDQDHLFPAPFPADNVWEAIKTHFGVETRLDLLDHCYVNFNKSKFAGLCVRLSEMANDGDKLCVYLFEEAGRLMARAIQALYPNADASLTQRCGGLHIVCVGSVWLSWNLLETGFVSQMRTTPDVKELSLIRLKASGAMGASYLAADIIQHKITRNYEDNYSIFYNYRNH